MSSSQKFEFDLHSSLYLLIVGLSSFTNDIIGDNGVKYPGGTADGLSNLAIMFSLWSLSAFRILQRNVIN